MKNSTKITVLWGLMLFGLVFHSQIEMMPLFFGANIAIPEATGNMPESMAWMCLVTYLIPMLCIVGILYFTSAWFKIINLVLAAAFALMNATHLVMHTMESPDAIQPVLLSFILLISILLLLSSYKWKRDARQ